MAQKLGPRELALRAQREHASVRDEILRKAAADRTSVKKKPKKKGTHSTRPA